MYSTNGKSGAAARLPYPFNTIARLSKPTIDAAQALRRLEESEGADVPTLDDVKLSLMRTFKASFDALEALNEYFEESDRQAFYNARQRGKSGKTRQYQAPFRFYAFMKVDDPTTDDADKYADDRDALERQIRIKRIVDAAQSIGAGARQNSERYRERGRNLGGVWYSSSEEEEIETLVDKFELDDRDAHRSYYDAKRQAFQTLESVASLLPLIASLSFEENEQEEQTRNMERGY